MSPQVHHITSTLLLCKEILIKFKQREMESLGKRMGFQKPKENMIFLLVSEDEKSYRDKNKEAGNGA